MNIELKHSLINIQYATVKFNDKKYELLDTIKEVVIAYQKCCCKKEKNWHCHVCMNKFMRIMVLFDLPTKNKSDRKKYSEFRRFLLNDGFQMLQHSVYVRLCNGSFDVEKHAKRIQANTPKKGRAIMLIVTNNQYEDMKYLVGQKSKEKKKILKKSKNDSQINSQLTLF